MKLVAAFLQLIAAIDEHYCNSTELGFKGDLENCLCPNGFHLAHLAAYKESLQFFMINGPESIFWLVCLKAIIVRSCLTGKD